MNIEMQLLCVAAVCAAYCSVLQLCQLVDIAQLLYCCTCGVMSKFKSRDLCHGIYHPAPHITHEGTELRASTLNMGDLQIGHNPNRCPQTKTVKRGGTRNQKKSSCSSSKYHHARWFHSYKLQTQTRSQGRHNGEAVRHSIRGTAAIQTVCDAVNHTDTARGEVSHLSSLFLQAVS